MPFSYFVFCASVGERRFSSVVEASNRLVLKTRNECALGFMGIARCWTEFSCLSRCELTVRAIMAFRPIILLRSTPGLTSGHLKCHFYLFSFAISCPSCNPESIRIQIECCPWNIPERRSSGTNFSQQLNVIPSGENKEFEASWELHPLRWSSLRQRISG